MCAGHLYHKRWLPECDVGDNGHCYHWSHDFLYHRRKHPHSQWRNSDRDHEKYFTPVTVGARVEKFFNALAYKSGMTDSVVTDFDADNEGTLATRK
jgi:hypothetical protein